MRESRDKLREKEWDKVLQGVCSTQSEKAVRKAAQQTEMTRYSRNIETDGSGMKSRFRLNS